jgi:acyl-CoA synthetase (AMP-forming)/AMP-acid ligase II
VVSVLPLLDASPLVAHLAAYGDRVALLGDGAPDRGLTYAELAGRVASFAGRLGTERRLVLVEGGNDAESLVAYLGTLAAGCPVLLTGPGQPLDSLATAYDPDVVWTSAGGLDERRERAATELHPELALLMSTSGTTGSPKLVRLSWANLVANARAIADYLAIDETDVAATTLPLHYCYGLSVVHSHLLRGAGLLLTHRSVADPEFWDAARRFGVTSLAGVPYTFELLDRVGFADMHLPRLRRVTQAGGRMAPETVRRYARLGQRRGWDLVVMYGATEATARMAWLPPLLAADAPETIGIPIPGGSFTIEPLPERPLVGPGEPEVGELVYRGDNVMLGYAECPADLALGRTVHELRTGDVGRQREDGLFEVVGRRSRMAKVFGLRVDLDRVERLLAGHGLVVAAADGGDALVLAVCSGAAPVDAARVTAVVRDEIGVPSSGVRLVTPVELPRLPNGKTDYRALVQLAAPADPSLVARPAAADPSLVARPAVADPSLVARPAAADPSLVALVDLFSDLLGRPDATGDDTFVGLGGDSLSYVEASLQLERMLGELPADWPTRPLRDLVRSARGSGRRGRSVETGVVLRALAIVAIVGSHANLFAVLGGAHVLLGVLGFNFGRFHADTPRAQRARAVSRSVVRVAVPSVLVIGLSSLWVEGLGWKQVLLLNGVLGSEGWTEPAWHYWFIEAALALMIFSALLLAVPQVDRLVRRAPFWLPFGLVLVGLVPRFERLAVFPDGDVIHRGHAVFWLFALGWAAARSATVWHRLLLSTVVLACVPGFFVGDARRDLAVVLGMLALIWVSRVRLPAVVARAVGVLAAASLWIYLVHWQVYPWLEFRMPLAATVLSLAAGVVAWQSWERLRFLHRL